MWDVARGTCTAKLTGHSAPVYSVSWSPDGRSIASGSSDETIKVWDVATSTCTAMFKTPGTPRGLWLWPPSTLPMTGAAGLVDKRVPTHGAASASAELAAVRRELDACRMERDALKYEAPALVTDLQRCRWPLRGDLLPLGFSFLKGGQRFSPGWLGHKLVGGSPRKPCFLTHPGSGCPKKLLLGLVLVAKCLTETSKWQNNRILPKGKSKGSQWKIVVPQWKKS